MKNIRYYINRLGIIQVSLVLLLIGLIFGVLIANLFKNSYIEQIQNLSQMFLQVLQLIKLIIQDYLYSPLRKT